MPSLQVLQNVSRKTYRGHYEAETTEQVVEGFIITYPVSELSPHQNTLRISIHKMPVERKAWEGKLGIISQSEYRSIHGDAKLIDYNSKSSHRVHTRFKLNNYLVIELS